MDENQSNTHREKKAVQGMLLNSGSGFKDSFDRFMPDRATGTAAAAAAAAVDNQHNPELPPWQQKKDLDGWSQLEVSAEWNGRHSNGSWTN